MAKFFASFGKLRLSSYSSKLLILALLAVPFPLAAAVSITYELVARSGVTTVPGSTVKFNGFGAAPAIDKQGNVVFTGGGTGRFGVYTALGGTCCQIVADNYTPLPGGGGATFYDFSGVERHDIDNGRVAFKAKSSLTRTALYSNVGQASASTLVEVTALDNVEWSVLGDPWVDGTTVGIYGNRLIPSAHNAILLWNGATGGESFVNPGTGYNVGYNSQASLAGNAAILARAKTGSFQMGISSGSTFEVLATANQTVMPDLGVVFTNFYPYPVVDDGGQDAAFVGYGNPNQGLFKRVNGGALQNVVDNTTPAPSSGGNTFTIIFESAIALANGQVLFGGMGQSSLKGVYTDVGGALAVLFDNGLNSSIVVGGQTLGVSNFDFSTRSFAYTPQGYMAVFRLDLVTGGSAIIRARIHDGNGTFTVHKDFSNNSTASVSITASCSSGTVTNSPQLASEAAPAVFNVTGAVAGTTCTATEPTVPSGYTRNQTDCQNGDPLWGSCTIINSLTSSSGTFTVHKDFSNNSTASVSITASCSSGTVTNSPQLASEAAPAVFNVTGALSGATCTATEPTVPSGYTRNQTDCQNGDPLNGSCTIVNTLNTVSGTFTVHKDFSNNNTASVSMTASCSSGTVTNSPQLASEAAPAVFNVTGALSGATCTATEPTIPTGYTRNQTDCQNGDPLNGSCTIVNTLNTSSSSFTVYKDFSDTNTASVSITAACTSGTVTNNPQLAREGVPAVFSISGALAGATCTATEPTIPSGYTRNQADCQNAKPLNGSCIIVNTRIPTAQQQTVLDEDFEDGNANGWSTSGSVDVNGEQSIGQYALRLSRSATAEAGVSTSGLSGVSVEMRLAGTSLEGSDSCFAELSTNGGSSWTTVVQVTSSNANGSFFAGTANPSAASNNANLRLRFRSTGGQNNDYCWGDEVSVLGTTASTTAGSFVVRKDFSDNNTANVTVSLNCSSGTVTNSPRTASEASPAVFYIQGQSTGATCSASESPVPSGYTANQSGCQDGDPVNGACTIVNTLNTTSNTFTVNKDFSDGNPASVSVTLSCSSGTIAINPKLASEGTPAVFNISGATTGSTCTATENPVPSGYTANQTGCQNGDPLNGSCTIINTAISNPGPVTILNSNFETGQATGWAISGDVAIDTATAIGQYSLRHVNNGASATRTVSTAGYNSVSVSMKLAAQSLEGNDSCFAEISTNGGSSWTPVLSLSSSNANGSFFSGTVSPAAASNNSNLRLRTRQTGNGNGDYCWLDDVMVVGTASGSQAQSGESSLQALSVSVTEPEASTFGVGTMSDDGPAASGFDPGFDQLVGSGNIIRRQLRYEELMGGSDRSSPRGLGAFGVPAGAGQPSAYFSGTLELRGEANVGQSDVEISASSLHSLPEFSFDFVQVGNHLFPVGSSVASTGSSGFDYVIDTGRVWREASDYGFSRATIPFMLMQMDGDCVHNGRLTFLFQDDGTTSRAAYQVTGSACGDAPEFTLWGRADALYTPGIKDLGATDIGTVLGCAAQNWLPLTIGDGGMTMVLTPDGKSHYVLKDAETSLWIDAADTGSAVDALCR